MRAARFVLPATLAGVSSGVLAADAGIPLLPAVAGATMAALVAVATRTPAFAIVAVLLAAACLGGWRASIGVADAGAVSVASLVDGAEHDLVGTILDDPRPREDRLQLVLGEIVVADAGAAAVADRLLVWLPRGIDARSGDRLEVRSRIELAEDFDGFAYREYLARQGIGGIARARSARVVAPASGPASVLAGVRGALLGGLNDLVPEPEAALGAGILLGVRSAIAPELNDAFATAGLTHVVAISGWNIAIVAALVTAAVAPLARRPGGRWTTSAIAAASVGGYVVLAGASPSVVRAALMAGAMLVARLGGSRAHAASALALAALVMVLVAPSVLWDVGFQLSLLATAGLIWFGASIERRLPSWPPMIREPVALTLAAQVTTLPVILVNFERLSLIAPIANVLVVPFVPIAMLLSAIAASVGAVGTVFDAPLVGAVLAWLASGAAWLVLHIVIWVATMMGSVPYASINVTVPPSFAVAWFPIVALATWALRGPPAETSDPVHPESGRLAAIARRIARPVPLVGAMVVILLFITVASRPDGQLHVTTLDIGQGDAILVETPSGMTMLVDGGPDPELTLRRLAANLPFHQRRIDLVVLSHPHQDHVAGLVEVLDRFSVGTIVHAGIPFENVAFDRLMADAARRGVPVMLARAGQTVALDGTTSMQVLYPSAGDATAPLPEGDINNASIVVVLRHGGFAALLGGDAKAPVETALVTRAVLPTVDLLKVGHHGSKSSTTPAFLDALRPSVAVISSGEGNDYGHPAPETLGTLRSRPGLAVLRTDLDGDVEVVSDGLSYRIRTDAGWSATRPVHRADPTGSIDPWLSPTDPLLVSCSRTNACPTASSSTARAWPGSPSRQRASWPRRRSPSTAPSSRRRRCCTTSTRSRSGAAAGSTASSARGVLRRWATRSLPCRSPPTPSPRCSTTTASRSAGHR